MDCSTPGLPIPHYLLEFAQVHVHWIGDAIQPPHLSPSSSAFNLSHHQGLFQWVSSSHQVAKVMELQLQHQSFQSIQGWFPLRLTILISLLSKALSRVFSRTIIWKHQFFSILPSLLFISHNSTWLLERPWPQLYGPFVGKAMSLLFNMLLRFVRAFLPRSNHLLISWLHSPSIVILEPPKGKSVPASTFPSSVCH